MDTGPRAARNDLFQELKPRCVELSQLALRDDGSSSSHKALVQSVSQLLSVLEAKCRRSDGVFDEKLAEYVFFPLSQILRRKQKYTDRLSELTIKCVRILLEYGWRQAISLDLAKQLLILLTFVAGGVPGKEAPPAPEELMLEAYGSLAALFHDLAVTAGGPAALIESGTIPALGHCITVILDGVTDGPTMEVHLQALQALDAVWSCIKDQEALSTFLPGTISGLTKCLVPGTTMRRSRKTLIKALEVLGHVLLSLLSDIRTRNIRKDTQSLDAEVAKGAEKKTLSISWLKATTAQIKLALSNVIRLRSHESVEVRKSLNRLCISILDECHDTLAESAGMLVETCMTLMGIDAEDNMSDQATSLIDLASIHPDISDLIKNTIYNWVTSLPRVMQSNDEFAKLTALGQLSKAHGILGGLNIESSILGDFLGNSLRDSITVTLEVSRTKPLQEEDFNLNSQSAMILATENSSSLAFKPVVLAEQSQLKTRDQLTALLGNLGTRESQINMANEMLEYARNATGPSLLSAYWLSSQILMSASSKNKDLDDFFESALTLSDEQEAANQELFQYSISLLTNDDRTLDWRMQAIALEVMAGTAQRMKEDFKTGLVDALYPVAQFLGSSNSQLREHAITSLNIISNSCGYKNTSELIVDNVDYMVNAISLRLNTFDISPQAPQVLVMMIRLTGPSLLLYLDDVVESIFAALDNFHGYHRLVDALFSVLGEIVSVGSKSNQLQITDTPTIDHQKKAPPPVTMNDILKLLKPTPKPDDDLPHKDFPKTPWKSAKTLLDEAEASSTPKDDEDFDPNSEEEPPPPQELAPPAPTKTYTMLTSIARLSQHYLTSSSPLLRSKLLSLLATSSNSLYQDENSFLPLVNDLWPVLITRLYDSETFVKIAACDTISTICRAAGDFLATRIKDEFPSIMTLARNTKREAEKEKGKGRGGRGIYSQNHQVWEAVIRLLVAVVGYVRIDDECFDEVLDVLGDLVWEREDVRGVLDAINADAVWLFLQREGKNVELEVPIMKGYQFVSLDARAVA
ncbi:ARM repeat-containing protein [Acephala macrosclerotiorum]|nr:ARM repeat-containing protein [Acephala macrosclerotiorum]